MLGTNGDLLFGSLFRQHIFAAIYKAFAQSLASENAARLAAMQAAEKNILEMEEKLQGRFRETRQNTITAELLDIISGFESINPA
jgi:F-type H+-transporting ATPase subunit gamma